MPDDAVEHPAYYGGGDNPYEVIKVAEAWGFDQDAYLFNVLKYIARPGKGNYLQDLKKARYYLNRKIMRLERSNAPYQWNPRGPQSRGGGGGCAGGSSGGSGAGGGGSSA